jgi:hypothetical protein
LLQLSGIMSHYAHTECGTQYPASLLLIFIVVDSHFLTLEWILQVTLINNLELYGINIQEFAKECQHGVAASTSISSVPGKKSQQLLVQGNQVLFVGNLLKGICLLHTEMETYWLKHVTVWGSF